MPKDMQGAIADYESHQPKKILAVHIDKINAIDKLKIAQEERLNKHNRQVKTFDEL